MTLHKREMINGPNEYKKNEIASLAEWIAEEYFGEDYIVDPEYVAEKNEISFSYGNYKNSFDGLLEHQFGKFHIYINLDRLQSSSQRMRFTFAHELGHYFIDEHRNALKNGRTPSHPSFNSLLAKNPVEREADFFAACLLMPAESFKRFCLGSRPGSKLFKELSENFDTSMSATIFRYFNLDIFPMMIIYCKDSKVEWTFPSNDFKYKWPPRKGDKIPVRTLAGDFFYKRKVNQKEDIVYPDDWFTDFEMDTSDELYEFCLSRNNSTLSVIWMKEH